MGTVLLTHEQLQQLEGIDSPTISNAIEAFGVRDATDGYASMELRCLYPDLPPAVGYAVTCTADSISPEKGRPDQAEALYKTLRDAPKPAIVVIQNVSSDRLRSCYAGDVMCTIFQALGAVGLITDGGVRDLVGIRQRAPGFRLFAPGVVVSHGVATIVEVGVPVTVCGLTIRTGDLLHGDLNGLVSIPNTIADRVAEQAKKVWENEQAMIDYVKSSSFSLEAYGEKYGW